MNLSKAVNFWLSVVIPIENLLVVTDDLHSVWHITFKEKEVMADIMVWPILRILGHYRLQQTAIWRRQQFQQRKAS